MADKEKILSYIVQMDLPFDEVDDGIWILYENEINQDQKLIISYAEEIVHFRLKVMEIPENKEFHAGLYRMLLENNITGLIHGAFAIENNSIVLVDSLQTENLDFNEFQASVEALFLGVVENYPKLSCYVTKEEIKQ